MTLEDLKIADNSIIICDLNTKKAILELLNKSTGFINIKFMTEKDFLESYYFSYDEKALYYLTSKYNYNIDLAKIYLKNLIYLDSKNYDNEKLNFLVNIKKELNDINLLYKNNSFIDYLNGKNIIFFKDNVSLFFKNTIFKLEKICNVKEITLKNNNYIPKIFEFNTIEDEVIFVASKICELVNNGININNIKLVNVPDNYYSYIKRIFDFYNIPININNKVSIYSTLIGKKFINDYSSNLDVLINEMHNNYDSDIIIKILNIVNKYAFIDDKLLVKDLVIDDLKNTYIFNTKYKNAIDICSENEIVEDNYVFLLSFNQKSYPKVYMDNDFLSNKERNLLNIETSLYKNAIEKNKCINFIKNIPNLIITYKLNSPTESFFPSVLINDLNLEVKKEKLSFNYSHKMNKLYLGKLLDKYYKYNEKDNNISVLYSNYILPYRKYDNKYTKIKYDDLNKVLNGKLNLSYSSMQKYNECAFKYYVDNILHLNVFEDNFSAYIGTIFHHILEIGLQKEIDVKKELELFTNGRVLNAKEKFYINKLMDDIILAIETVKNQSKYCSLTKIKTENEFKIIKNSRLTVTFKGFIDKMLYDSEDDKVYVAVIDYKTYDTDIKLDLIDYGLNLQLPVYLYLINNEIKNAVVVGFYVQKVLSTDNKYDKRKTLYERKKDNFKLTGFSNCDESILKKLDYNYADSSIIKGLKLTNDGRFSASSHVLSNEQMEKLQAKVEEQINNCISNIENCNFDINPKKYKEKNISCTYCKFKDLCFKTPKDEIEIEGGEENA